MYNPSSMLQSNPPVYSTTEPTVDVPDATGRDVPNLPMPRSRGVQRQRDNRGARP
jgi:hypothetical protein